MIKATSISVMTASFLLQTPCLAWEVSGYHGPLRDFEAIRSDVKKVKALSPALAGSPEALTGNINLTPQLTRRVLPYPYADGASLGQGWDFMRNEKAMKACLSFAVGHDRFQEASTKFTDVTDREMLSFSLNATLEGEAHGSFAGFGGKAESKMSMDGSHSYKSTDQMLVAQSSVLQGALFVTPVSMTPEQARTEKTEDQSGASIIPGVPSANISKLTLEQGLSELSRTDPEAFRQRCGDGFVASIVSGADLYSVFHFRDVSRESKLKIGYQSKAQAGFGSLFGGSASTTLNSELQSASSNNSIHISYSQLGGKIEKIPTDHDGIKAQVEKLAKQAMEGPRPLFIVVLPYSVLADWNAPAVRFPLTLKENLLRYQQRLTSAYFEYLNVREDNYRDPDAYTGNTQPGYSYMFQKVHRVRDEPINNIGDAVLTELSHVSKAIAEIEVGACKAASVVRSSSSRNHQSGSKSEDGSERRAPQSECTKRLIEHLPYIDYDDYKYLVRLPLPNNAIPIAYQNFFKGQTGTLEERRFLYTNYLYRHWVERVSNARCRVLGDCMTQAERQAHFQDIETSFKPTGYAIDSKKSYAVRHSIYNLTEDEDQREKLSGQFFLAIAMDPKLLDTMTISPEIKAAINDAELNLK